MGATALTIREPDGAHKDFPVAYPGPRDAIQQRGPVGETGEITPRANTHDGVIDTDKCRVYGVTGVTILPRLLALIVAPILICHIAIITLFALLQHAVWTTIELRKAPLFYPVDTGLYRVDAWTNTATEFTLVFID
jgi:hypothetical protein